MMLSVTRGVFFFLFHLWRVQGILSHARGPTPDIPRLENTHMVGWTGRFLRNGLGAGSAVVTALIGFPVILGRRCGWDCDLELSIPVVRDLSVCISKHGVYLRSPRELSPGWLFAVLVRREDLRPTASLLLPRRDRDLAPRFTWRCRARADSGRQMETFHSICLVNPHVCRPFDVQWSPHLHISTLSECLHACMHACKHASVRCCISTTSPRRLGASVARQTWARCRPSQSSDPTRLIANYKREPRNSGVWPGHPLHLPIGRLPNFILSLLDTVCMACRL